MLAQTVEDFTSLDPASGEQFGRAVVAADILNGPSGTQYWVIAAAPYADVGGNIAAGEVEFFPTINSPTTPPFKISAPLAHIQADAHFGWSLAAGDCDGDGTIDLVVGAPHQDVGNVQDQGRVIVLYGPWLPTAVVPYAHWAYLDVLPAEVSDPQAGEPGGQFGHSVAVGNLNLLLGLDLAVGAPHATFVGPPREPDVGGADIFLDVPPNDGVTPITRYNHVFTPNIWPSVTRQAGCLYGHAVGISQFAIDQASETLEPWGDVVVGSPNYRWDGAPEVGFLSYHFGHTDLGGNPLWDNTSPWTLHHLPIYWDLVNGPQYQHYGWALSVADHDGDGWDDVSVGAPGKVETLRGYIALERGDAHGVWWFTDVPNNWVDVTFGPPVNGPPWHLFGSAVAWFNKDNQYDLDLLIGAPAWNDYGAAFIGHSPAHRYPLSRWYFLSTPHADPTPNAGEQFGWAVCRALRFGTPQRDEEVIGAPHADVPGYPDAGEVFVFNH
ncbi:MAG: FG-GAP repeat protein [Planctomycetota bacterium]